jgi:hypothetical protein
MSDKDRIMILQENSATKRLQFVNSLDRHGQSIKCLLTEAGGLPKITITKRRKKELAARQQQKVMLRSSVRIRDILIRVRNLRS